MKRFIRSSNPALKRNTFSGYHLAQNSMTLEGTSFKTFIFLSIVVFFASWSWVNGHKYITTELTFNVFFYGAIVITIGLGFLTFKYKKNAFIFGSLYSAIKGLLLGYISSLSEAYYPGIAIQAVMYTFATMLAMLIIYRFRIIKITKNFKIGIMAASGAIGIVYLISFIGRFVGFSVPLLHESNLAGIIVSLLIIGVSSFNLLLDFDFIENGVKKGLPKYLEWYSVFGLMVTLIWIYVNIIKLLGKIIRRRR